MKLSMKFRDDTHQNPLLRAKIPITILGLPFLSGVAAGDSSDLSFSIRTNFSSGPVLSLFYHPTISTSPKPTITSPAEGGSSAAYPFSLSLKSGIGLFGSPQNSPLTFAAHFNLSSSNGSNPILTPTFSLLIKPQFGNFSLRKSTTSSNRSSAQLNGVRPHGEISNGFVSDSELINVFSPDKPLEWKDLRKVESFGETYGILSGIFTMAKTSMPLTGRSLINFRWGVNFDGQGSKLSRPVLVLNKIGLERVEEVKRVDDEKPKEITNGDLELLNGMCSWMRREIEDLQKGNMEIKQALEGIKMQAPNSRARGEERDSVGKRAVSVPSAESSGDGHMWRSRKSEYSRDGQREWHKSANRASEVEAELQKVIKAAAATTTGGVVIPLCSRGGGGGGGGEVPTLFLGGGRDAVPKFVQVVVMRPDDIGFCKAWGERGCASSFAPHPSSGGGGAMPLITPIA
ncbi:hypothetical protein Nepgr_011084 [Nepenthes gracilis]|uniref:Uncharacterized protein n=1 Tax=Nepenthes gracilis TaxID=150966 RepID=A0AAD3SDJ8_NEPGR|nr:hypothetical protein Nepgr_011084 [Nepenthes gracilis]